MERQELRWQGEHGLTNRTFIGLLDLTATGELVAGWTQEDYIAYRKRMEVETFCREIRWQQETRNHLRVLMITKQLIIQPHSE